MTGRWLAEVLRLAPPPGQEVEVPASELRRGMWLRDPRNSVWRKIARADLVDELISDVTYSDGAWLDTGYRRLLVFIRVGLVWGGELDLNPPALVIVRDPMAGRGPGVPQ